MGTERVVEVRGEEAVKRHGDWNATIKLLVEVPTQARLIGANGLRICYTSFHVNPQAI
jgi:hypothetical protein